MKILFLLLLAALAFSPGRSQAQFSPAEGSYELNNGEKGTATLKLVLAEGNAPTRLVGTKNGRERTFRSAQIKSFSIENHRFASISNFRFHSGTSANSSEPALLETIETGAVELFSYYYLVEMGTNFKAHVTLPVLRKAGTSVFFAYAPGRTPGFDLKPAPGGFVAALFPADPVLQRQLATGSIGRAQLAAAVRAYNQGTRLKP